MDWIQWVILALLVTVVVMLAFVLRKRDTHNTEALLQQMQRTDTFLQTMLQQVMQVMADENARSRGELQQALEGASRQQRQSVADMQTAIHQQISAQNTQIDAFTRQQAEQSERLRAALEERLASIRSGMTEQMEANRVTVTEGLDRNRKTVEGKLSELQTQNEQKLEAMRKTVDEKLHETLEKRLGESFQQVTKQLEEVYKGLGEMQALAGNVGDLKRVLTNVKTRGMWGEVQLGAILEQVMSPEQYARNVAVRPRTQERADYAVKLPGTLEGETIWLPIDAKFPLEDYQRLVAAGEAADPVAAEEAGKQLEQRIRLEARSIKDKYIHPPHTTEFALMFLPVEGLYSEVLRRPGLAEDLQRDCQVIVAGPTVLLALLNSLQVGFRTLAIQKRSSDIAKVLGAVKFEFSKFTGLLEKTQKKLQEASNSIESAASKSRNIESKLRNVASLDEPMEMAFDTPDAPLLEDPEYPSAEQDTEELQDDMTMEQMKII